MNRDDRLRASNDLDQRLRAAGDALREGSTTQVDAATALREILLHADPLPEPASHPAASPVPPASRLFSRPQRRLALAANLVLVLALGVAIGIGVQRVQDTVPLTPVPTARAATTAVPSSTANLAQTVSSVPEQCVEMADLADEAISRLNRNVRDERLFLALRDYTIASQACRREASP
jgi:hypothetical protein